MPRNSRLRLVAYCKECRLFLSLEGQRGTQGGIRPDLNWGEARKKTPWLRKASVMVVSDANKLPA